MEKSENQEEKFENQEEKFENQEEEFENQEEEFENLKKVRTFQRGGKSKSVHLLENNIVKKSYNSKDIKQINRFKKEVKILKFLEEKNCPFVPKLLHVDSQRHRFYMTYTGKTLTNTPKNQKELAKKVKELHLKYGVMRHRNGKPNYDIYISNGTIKDDQIYIIDFGSPHYSILK